MNESGSLTSDVVYGRFQALYRAFALHQQCNARGPDTLPIEKSCDDLRVPPDPYPGLRSFTPHEGGIFFGRERNVDEVRQRLADRNFAVILGSSGSGKSSLIRAGLIPRLNSTKGIPGRLGNWYAAEFRPRLHPMDELATSLENLVSEFFPNHVTGEPDRPKKSSYGECLTRLRAKAIDPTPADRSSNAEALSDALFEFVDIELDRLDRAASHGLRSGKPSLLLVVDQFEEVFRPEVAMDQAAGGRRLLDLLIASCAMLTQMRRAGMQSGLFLVITMRSEELHRCTEYPSLPVRLKGPPVACSLADMVNSGMYLLDLLDPETDRDELREAIVSPARRVFVDWGLPFDKQNEDAPFASGVVDWLLEGAAKLSLKLEHRPDQLPLLQHALQTIWRGAIDEWSLSEISTDHLIRKEHLCWPAQQGEAASAFPDLAACLDRRANKTLQEGISQFSTTTANPHQLGEEIIRAAFRALAQRDDRGNWARRFADAGLIKLFLASAHPLGEGPDFDEGIPTAMSSFVSRGYLVLKGGYYDISHEALIRNWKRYQDWLQDPKEISNALLRVVADLDPGRFTRGTGDVEDDLLSNLPQATCDALSKLFDKQELPQSWASEQLLQVVSRADVAKRWGTTKPTEVLKRLENLVNWAQRIRVERANARQLRQRRRVILGATVASIVALAVIGALWGAQQYWEHEAQINHAKRIALHAGDALDYEGPVQAVLIAEQAQKQKLPNIPETEQVIYNSLRQLREKRKILGPTANPRETISFAGVTTNPTGDVVAGLTRNGSIFFWRAVDGKLIDQYDLEHGSVQTSGIQWNPGGGQLAIGVGNRTEIVIPCSHSGLRPFFTSCAEDQTQDLVWRSPPEVKAGPGKFRQDGKSLITSNWQAKVHVWNADTKEDTDLKVDTIFPSGVALAPNGQIAAIGAEHGIVKIIDLGTKEEKDVKVQEDDNSAILSVDFGKDSNLLVVSMQSNHIRVLDLKTEKSTLADGLKTPAFQAVFSGDGRHIAAGGADGELRVWSIERLNRPAVLKGHRGPIHSLQFTQDGQTLVSASADGTIRMWSLVPALHYSGPPVGSIADEQKPTVPIDRSEVARAVNRDGYTVVAYADSRLALFGPKSSTVPITEWGSWMKRQWRSVRFDDQNTSSKPSTTQAIVATSTTGEDSWPYFKDITDLIKFADDHIPFQGSEKVKLPDQELCKLDLLDKTKCNNEVPPE
jgi:WD domain, G-beta repeat